MTDAELLNHILFGVRVTGPALDGKLRFQVQAGLISPQLARQVRELPADPEDRE